MQYCCTVLLGVSLKSGGMVMIDRGMVVVIPSETETEEIMFAIF